MLGETAATGVPLNPRSMSGRRLLSRGAGWGGFAKDLLQGWLLFLIDGMIRQKLLEQRGHGPGIEVGQRRIDLRSETVSPGEPT